MNKIPVIAIYDVGKTNKKLLLFDEHYHIVYEQSTQLPEVSDEKGFPCEDVQALAKWVESSYETITTDQRYFIKAVNFSAYGASFVYLDKEQKRVLPLYNYLKPFPQSLQKDFFTTYGGESLLAKQTASPVLGNLNSGLQLYRLKQERPTDFEKIQVALHLPQYLSFLLSSKVHAEMTSIGCHTLLWNFQLGKYHSWVEEEGISRKFPAIADSTSVFDSKDKKVVVGIGLHDSSAALIPYLSSFNEPFILLSTGTWCISLNPFNQGVLSDYELHQDCLCYLSYKGKPVKASRLFAGYEHEQQVKRLSTHFNTDVDYYKTVAADKKLIGKVRTGHSVRQHASETAMVGQSHFAERKLESFNNYEEAYHQLIADIMNQQFRSTSIVLKGTVVKRIFVDGGFSQNPIYMELLAAAFPEIEVYAASMPQASALGAALVIHHHWNKGPVPSDIISLQLYSPPGKV
jgi:sugar (pentulose or hexulose) kinase